MLHIPDLHRPAVRPAPAGSDSTTPLHAIPPFDGLDADEAQRLLRNAVEFDLRTPTLVFRRGEPGAELHVLLGGVVRLLGPNDTVLGVVEGAGVLDLADLFAGRRVVSALAERRSRLLYVPASAITDLLIRCPNFAVTLAQELGRHHAAAVENLIELRCYDPVARLAAYLLKKLPDGPKPLLVHLGVKKGVLANQLDMTAGCFARSLTRLVDAGLVRRRRKGIEVIDARALHRIIGEAT